MINPKHPLEYQHNQQEFFLKHLPEKDKEYHTLRIAYSNAVYLYYRLQLNASIYYSYKEWLNGITDEKLRNTMRLKGYEACKNTFSFKRFMYNKRNISEEDYIKEIMGKEKYDRFKILCTYF